MTTGATRHASLSGCRLSQANQARFDHVVACRGTTGAARAIGCSVPLIESLLHGGRASAAAVARVVAGLELLERMKARRACIDASETEP